MRNAARENFPVLLRLSLSLSLSLALSLSRRRETHRDINDGVISGDLAIDLLPRTAKER